MSSDQQRVDKTKRAYHALSHASLGLEMGISVALGFAGGYWLDDYLGTTPWLTFVLLGCGIAAAFRAVWRAGQPMRQVAASENDETNGATGAPERREPDQ